MLSGLMLLKMIFSDVGLASDARLDFFVKGKERSLGELADLTRGLFGLLGDLSPNALPRKFDEPPLARGLLELFGDFSVNAQPSKLGELFDFVMVSSGLDPSGVCAKDFASAEAASDKSSRCGGRLRRFAKPLINRLGI